MIIFYHDHYDNNTVIWKCHKEEIYMRHSLDCQKLYECNKAGQLIPYGRKAIFNKPTVENTIDIYEDTITFI